MKPSVLMAGRTRYSLPLSASLDAKFAALDEELDVHVLAAERRGTRGADPRFTLIRPLPGSRRPAVLRPLPLPRLAGAEAPPT